MSQVIDDIGKADLPAQREEGVVSLRYSNCANCGYQLTDALNVRVCPECGRSEDASEIILHGWGSGRSERLATASPQRLGRLLILLSLPLVIYIQYLRGWERYVIVGLIVATYLESLLRRRGTLHPGLVQVRLDPHGCVQYDRLGGITTVQDLMLRFRWLIQFGFATYLVSLALRSRNPILTWQLAISIPLLALIGFRRWQASQRYAHATRTMREAAIVDANAAVTATAPWSAIAFYSLQATRPSTYRLQVARKAGTGWRTIINTGRAVDAEIELRDEQAAALRKQLDCWVW